MDTADFEKMCDPGKEDIFPNFKRWDDRDLGATNITLWVDTANQRWVTLKTTLANGMAVPVASMRFDRFCATLGDVLNKLPLDEQRLAWSALEKGFEYDE